MPSASLKSPHLNVTQLNLHRSGPDNRAHRDFHLLDSHGLVSAHVGKEVLRADFVQNLNALQGRRATRYTGASWGVHLSTSLDLYRHGVAAAERDLSVWIEVRGGNVEGRRGRGVYFFGSSSLVDMLRRAAHFARVCIYGGEYHLCLFHCCLGLHLRSKLQRRCLALQPHSHRCRALKDILLIPRARPGRCYLVARICHPFVNHKSVLVLGRCIRNQC